MKQPLTMVAALAAMCFATQSQARPERTAQVPNGMTRSCPLCHVGANFNMRTTFGEQVQEFLVGDDLMTATVDWAALADEDADGDGATNGDELGDPAGTWQPGDADPAFQSDPSDPASVPPGGAGGAGGGGGGADMGVGAGGGDEGDGGDSGGCDTTDSAPTAPLMLLALLGGVVLRRR